MNLHANAALSLNGRRELCRHVVERVGRYRVEGEAAWVTTPAMSSPGRQLMGRAFNSGSSPRFGGLAWTSMSASVGPGSSCARRGSGGSCVLALSVGGSCARRRQQLWLTRGHVRRSTGLSVGSAAPRTHD
jgi:hypothetical protein